MKNKIKLIGISIVGCLLFLSSINVSNALPPDWVGVSAGDSFTWKITVNAEPLLDLYEDLNITGEMPPDYSTYFVGSASINVKVNVKSVSDEMDFMGTKYVNVLCSLSLVFPGTTTIEDIAEFNHIIVKFQDNYTGGIMDLASGVFFPNGTIGGLFMPMNMNWTILEDEINTLKSMVPEIPGNISITALENGMNVNYPGGYFEFNVSNYIFNGTFGEVDATVRYNANGVLSDALIKYGGATIITVGFAEEEIFGYELSIILIITTSAVIGLIYYTKRKKRIS
ncbi:MAG: hypothetical protein ACFE9X_01615 [Promethearchaeota archaeon]